MNGSKSEARSELALVFGFSNREKSKEAFLNVGTMCSSSGMKVLSHRVQMTFELSTPPPCTSLATCYTLGITSKKVNMFKVYKNTNPNHENNESNKWEEIYTSNIFEEAHTYAQDIVCKDIYHEGSPSGLYWFSDEKEQSLGYKVVIDSENFIKLK
jgi:hypothetical protein